MTEPISLRIGGVPEYFNLPIHLAIESDIFQEFGIDLHWQDVPEGTGKMVEALQSGSLDLAVVLTEGMVKSRANGNSAEIIHIYVESPLLWGVHVSAASEFQTIEALEEQAFAISRFGSGSHLMAALLAREQGWLQSDLRFEVVNTLEGARKALANQTAQIFLWEKYTTQFLVDNGEFRRVGIFPTPWPCFVVAASRDVLDRHPTTVDTFLKVLTKATTEFMQREDLVSLIAERYDLHEEDVREFLPNTQWNTSVTSADSLERSVLATLKEVGQLPS